MDLRDQNYFVNGRFLWFLTLTYSMIIVLANWFDPRLIKIIGLTTDAGTIVFPLTFLLSDLITEVYGYKFARRAIWCGFLFNLIFIAYGQIISYLPSPNYPNINSMFDTILAINVRIIVASLISYLCAEPLNSFIMAKLKIKTNGKFMSFRFITSTFLAASVDSFIFGTIAFYGFMNNQNLINLILTMWFIKVMIEILGLPVSVTLSKKLKILEQTDIFDKQTKFNIFKLETNYTKEDNNF